MLRILCLSKDVVMKADAGLVTGSSHPCHSPSCGMNTNEHQHCRSHLHHLHLLHNKSGGFVLYYVSTTWLFSWHLEAPASRDECVKVNGTSRVETKYPQRQLISLTISRVDGLSISAPRFRRTASIRHLLIILRKHLKKNRILRGKEQGKASESNIIVSLNF